VGPVVVERLEGNLADSGLSFDLQVVVHVCRLRKDRPYEADLFRLKVIVVQMSLPII
jgi:hypothetical protein